MAKSLEEKISDLDQFFIESVEGLQGEALKKKLFELDK